MSIVLRNRKRRPQTGVILVLTAVLMVLMCAFLAFSVDVGYIALTRAQLQNAADAGALAAAAYVPTDSGEAIAQARQFASYQLVGGSNLGEESLQVEFGSWDGTSRTFTASPSPGNAVRVAAERTADRGGQIPLFFASVLGIRSFECRASAVATTNPRDIAFVVDLSGSMNNDTEPCWATSEIDNAFGPQGYPTVGDELMQQLYDDFGFGTFPGTLQSMGQSLGIAADQYAYAEMTKNSGPLTNVSIPSQYRISNTDSESTRRQKAYKWVIDYQIAPLMLNVTPAPNSSNSASYAYWARYLDFIIRSQQITSSSPKGKPRPSYPVTLPPSQSSDRINGFGNPYSDAFPGASSSVPLGYQNKIGFRTYVQFMMDFGRDKQAASNQYVPLSRSSAHCPWHSETTEGGTFDFPPREQPTHAARRALIAAIQVIKERNQGVSDPNERDWVSIVTFDKANSVSIVRSLTYNYDAAMQDCTTLQAVADDANSTATETGLLLAKNHIASPDNGGQGRRYTNKVVVFLTDGIPNLYSSSPSSISDFVGENPSDNFYPSAAYPENAALMQCMAMQLQRWQVFPVGIGLGCDYDFMDRSARLGGTANNDGQGPRGSGNPAEYEQRLKQIFQGIITNPRARLVE